MEVADGEERNKKREQDLKQKDWEETKKYLADQKANRVPSGYGPAVPGAGARAAPAPQASPKNSAPPPTSPRGPSGSVEATWSRSAPKGSSAAAAAAAATTPQRGGASPQRGTPLPEDPSHPKLVGNTNNSGITLVPLAQAQAAQVSYSHTLLDVASITWIL